MIILWALFGNDDDGYYGDNQFNPKQIKSFWWAWKWWWRNPFHNLTHYVIGFKNHVALYSGYDLNGPSFGIGYTYRDNGKKYPLLILNGDKWLRYIGWRPTGAFGIKFRKRPNVN